MKASCLGKALGTVEGLTSTSGWFIKRSSLRFIFLFCFALFISLSLIFFFTPMEIPPGFAVQHLSPVPACSDKLAKWLRVEHPWHPPPWVQGTIGAVLQIQLNLCVQEWFSLPINVVLHFATHTLLSGELCFCSFLLSVVQWFTVVLEVIPLHFNAATVLPLFIYLSHCLVWFFISDCFSFPQVHSQ